ncbi:MAG: hypothetical protein KKG75_00160 [Nanoarchaeota archaeon]|nr:hypothetical protein [Nanoarchaeota archaeon]
MSIREFFEISFLGRWYLDKYDFLEEEFKEIQNPFFRGLSIILLKVLAVLFPILILILLILKWKIGLTIFGVWIISELIYVYGLKKGEED